ncbi:hypothetical protein FF1_027536 [Malus domestica]
MRSDRGGEFTSKEFQEFCEANGIRRPLTVPRSPQQNGVAERKNQTIIDMARSMLKSKRLPKEMWAEAVACAVYLSNRSPTRNKKRTKLDDKSEKFIFIGYDSNSKGYKLYNPNNGKLVISRDVTFDEEGEWDFCSHAGDLHFFPQFEEENEQGMMEQAREVQQESTTPLASPTSINHGNSPASASSSGSLNEREVPRTRSLRDLYEVAERLDNPTLFCLFADCEPVDFQEAMQDTKWRKAMDEEIEAIQKNDTWELAILLKGHKAIRVKWVYKTKKNANGEVERYKARLVANGYSQRARIDYDEQSSGYEIKAHEDKVLKLKKALYGLKQAP